MNAVTSIESRALELLGNGVSQENAALALGVTPSAISQLMAQEEFAARVTELRFQNLNRHNQRDTQLDQLEDSLIEKLKDMLPLVMRPMEVTRILQVVNSAKRRGASAPEQLTQQKEVVNLTLPVAILNQITQNNTFQITSDNHVVSAGEQTLVTLQSRRLPALLSDRAQSTLNAQNAERIGNENGGIKPQGTIISSKGKQVFDVDI